MLWHCFNSVCYDQMWQGVLVLMSPLRILVDGTAAVVVFFVLSGFVLSLPYFEGRPPLYRHFLIRRFCRIYFPFAAAIFFAICVYAVVDRNFPQGAIWLNGDFPALYIPPSFAVTPEMVIRHLLMIGYSMDVVLDVPMWSLIHEVRISLILPLLVMACRHRWLGFALVAGLTVVTSSIDWRQIDEFIVFPTDPLTVFSSAFATAFCLPYFLWGILLAKHRRHIASILARLSHAKLTLLWTVVAVIFFLYNTHDKRTLLSLAATMLIALTLSSPTASSVLRRRVFQWLGRISYSLYLLHIPVLFAAIHILHAYLPWGIVLTIGCAGSLLAATAMCALVEVPSIRLGKKLTGLGGIRPRRPPETP